MFGEQPRSPLDRLVPLEPPDRNSQTRQPIDSFPLIIAWNPMCVDLHGDIRVGVTQLVANVGYGCALCQEQTGEGVSQIMESDVP